MQSLYLENWLRADLEARFALLRRFQDDGT